MIEGAQGRRSLGEEAVIDVAARVDLEALDRFECRYPAQAQVAVERDDGQRRYRTKIAFRSARVGDGFFQALIREVGSVHVARAQRKDDLEQEQPLEATEI